jgi:tRNA pseudouridine55 synthase
VVDGFFNVYKPKGPTSHDVVARLRRASGVRRIGHAGTLDPMAEGVLVVGVGQATRLIEYLVDATKVYRAEVTFGVETDTYDAEGRGVAERPVGDLTRAAVEAALPGFRGEIEQRPPPFSAVSVGGQRLYALARRGEAVAAPARRITIHRLDLQAWHPPVARLEVECSKGTYVRSLAHDLGQALDCGAHLSALVRLRSGSFTAQDAVPLDDLEARLREGRWQEVARPPATAVAHLTAVHLDEDEAARLTNGQAVAATSASGNAGPAGPPGEALPPSGTLGGAFGPGGRLLAVVRLDRAGDRPVWRPEKVLAGRSGQVGKGERCV